MANFHDNLWDKSLYSCVHTRLIWSDCELQIIANLNKEREEIELVELNELTVTNESNQTTQ